MERGRGGGSGGEREGERDGLKENIGREEEIHIEREKGGERGGVIRER